MEAGGGERPLCPHHAFVLAHSDCLSHSFSSHFSLLPFHTTTSHHLVSAYQVKNRHSIKLSLSNAVSLPTTAEGVDMVGVSVMPLSSLHREETMMRQIGIRQATITQTLGISLGRGGEGK